MITFGYAEESGLRLLGQPLRDNWLNLARAVVDQTVYDLAGARAYDGDVDPATIKRFLKGKLFAAVVEEAGGDPAVALQGILDRARVLRQRRAIRPNARVGRLQ